MKFNNAEGITESVTLNDKAWDCIFERYDIVEQVRKNGMFHITASQIKEFREPRLMTKFDTRDSIPRAFGKGKEKMSILPDSRGSYVIGYFDTYLEFPDMERRIKHVEFPDYLQTISKRNINSEANVINVLGVTNILEDFLSENGMIQTISGRMKSGVFDFFIQDTRQQVFHKIAVKNAQIEVDAGFENQNCVCIMEAKNVVHKDFIVRQLYYPYRCWEEKVGKPVRTVFMVYSNNVFRLLEYEFTQTDCYSSIQFIRQKNYSFEDVDIKHSDLMECYQRTRALKEPREIPFIQADSFNTVISLLEIVTEEPKTIAEISSRIGFATRQGDYYFNAAKYLGLTEKITDADGSKKVELSALGKRVMNLPYKERQLMYIELMFQHEIFRETFFPSAIAGRLVDKDFIQKKMSELNVCGPNLVGRRASSVMGWLRWIFSIINE
ncbi:type II restriction enzyme [[Clostridium] polysaccharolyticum]|uniref:Uncharacterized protein n=1 Tax=[Clostridium] polysaccharolyticum TaxID=29364 RepID=A0A1I0D9T1_9FIRM|nr:hypothetical protein [[Clostridium] polysaccharolyticum]SET28289.1 hypothetical protein SAMN04487772_11345 [[Clostridium] polysaccharolyticum]